MDVLAEYDLGIIASSEETVRLSGLRLVPFLPEYVGDTIEFFVRVNKQFFLTDKCQAFLKWIFECRDRSLAKLKEKSPYA